MIEHVRTGNGAPFGPHGDPENGPNCADTVCEACGCCMHCEHACQCSECGCIEHRDDHTVYPSAESDPALLAADVKRLRTQLGCVKALATLWEEEAGELREQADRYDEAGSTTAAFRLRMQAHTGESNAAALREMLAD